MRRLSAYLAPTLREDPADAEVVSHKLLVRAEFARHQRSEDYYDQNSSPLGRRRHNELARSGAVAAVKYRGHWMVRKDDLHAFLQKTGKTVGRRESDEDVDDILVKRRWGDPCPFAVLQGLPSQGYTLVHIREDFVEHL